MWGPEEHLDSSPLLQLVCPLAVCLPKRQVGWMGRLWFGVGQGLPESGTALLPLLVDRTGGTVSLTGTILQRPFAVPPKKFFFV